ncbi:hypothetical protein Sste5346_010126 [Sporothrix stenoceras]|uniref:Uncharacterized protein n=1 Tax=Sporothrix stenoceras TaxID=5173 RepID=A0ABR3YGW5_9PEZI
MSGNINNNGAGAGGNRQDRFQLADFAQPPRMQAPPHPPAADPAVAPVPAAAPALVPAPAVVAPAAPAPAPAPAPAHAAASSSAATGPPPPTPFNDHAQHGMVTRSQGQSMVANNSETIIVPRHWMALRSHDASSGPPPSYEESMSSDEDMAEIYEV